MNPNDEELQKYLDSLTDEQVAQEMPTDPSQIVPEDDQAAPATPDAGVPNTSVNPLVAKSLMDKYSPEAREQLTNSLQKPTTSQIIGEGFAGLGDAIARGYGHTNTNYGKETSDAIATQRDQALGNFDAGRKDIQYQRTQNQQGQNDDPSSDMSKQKQTLAARMLGKKPEDFANMSGTSLDAQLPTLEKMYQVDENAKTRKYMADQSKANREVMMGTKEDQWTETQWGKLTDKVNSINAGSRKALGVAAINNMRADRLLETINNPMVTSQDINNITADLQAIYKGGVPDQVSLAHGDYPTFQRKLNEAIQYITAKPQDAGSPEIVKRLHDIALELKQVDNKVITKNLGINAVGYRKIIQKDPGRWNDLTNAVSATTANPTESNNPSAAAPAVTKTIGGKTYIKRNGQWFPQ